MEEINTEIENQDNDSSLNGTVTEITETEKGSTKKSPQVKKFTRLPLARVKNIMKQDPDISLLANDAVFLVTKATEMFIEMVSKKAVGQIMNTKRKTVQRRDVDTVVENVPNLCFLEGALD